MRRRIRITDLRRKPPGEKTRREASARKKLNDVYALWGIALEIKNYRPPLPIGVKGGCSPQNNCGNIRRLLNQRPAHDNQAFAGFSRDTSAVIRNPSFEGANQSKEGDAT